MTAARLLPLWLLAIVGLALGAEPQADKKEASFASQVGAMLRSPWTEIHITQALITDYGEIYALTVVLFRDKPGGPVSCQTDGTSGKKPMSKAQFERLQEVMTSAANEVEEIQTPPEILSGVRPEEAAKLIRDRKVSSGWDVEALVIFCSKPSAVKPLSNGGFSRKFVHFLEQEFGSKQRNISRQESQGIFGLGSL